MTSIIINLSKHFPSFYFYTTNKPQQILRVFWFNLQFFIQVASQSVNKAV